MFEPFKNATTGAKVVHVLLVLYLFLSWVSTMVTFGSSMIKMTNGPDISADLKWNKYIMHSPVGTFEGSVKSFDELVNSHCETGSQATLAFAIFAFLAFLIHIPILLARLAGGSFPMIHDASHSMRIEFYLVALEFFCFFIQVCVYGGSCFTPATKNFSATGTGFGLMLACFFFLLISLGFYVLMRSNTAYAVGDGSGKASDHSGYGDNYAASGNGEYSNEISSQPTFSYQGGSEST